MAPICRIPPPVKIRVFTQFTDHFKYLRHPTYSMYQHLNNFHFFSVFSIPSLSSKRNLKKTFNFPRFPFPQFPYSGRSCTVRWTLSRVRIENFKPHQLTRPFPLLVFLIINIFRRFWVCAVSPTVCWCIGFLLDLYSFLPAHWQKVQKIPRCNLCRSIITSKAGKDESFDLLTLTATIMLCMVPPALLCSFDALFEKQSKFFKCCTKFLILENVAKCTQKRKKSETE